MSLGCRPYGAGPSFLQYFSKNRRPAYNTQANYPQPDSDTGRFPLRTRGRREVEDVALGTRVFHRRADRRFIGIHGDLPGSGRHCQDPILFVSNSFPRHIDGAPATQVMIDLEKASICEF